MMMARSRRDHDPEERLLASWERRVQRVSLRTKIVVPVVVLAVAPALVIAIVSLLRIQESLEESAAQRIMFETASKALAVARIGRRFVSNGVRSGLGAADSAAEPENGSAKAHNVARGARIGRNSSS